MTPEQEKMVGLLVLGAIEAHQEKSIARREAEAARRRARQAWAALGGGYILAGALTAVLYWWPL